MPADLPSGYSAGTITVPANTPSNLFSLLQAQVDTQCSNSATAMTLSADGANGGPVFIGMNLKMNATSYGRSIAPGAQASYGSGASSAIQVGRMYLFSAAGATVHVELFP